jgi:hypothetical protein
MTVPHNDQNLGKPLRIKKKRGAVFTVIVASIVVHLVGLGGLAAIKIIEVLQPEAEFESPPIEPIKPPPPPPPPPPTTKRAQKSLPRPQPLAARNPQNMDVPSIEVDKSALSLGAGRGFGGGLGELGGAVADALRITSFGYDRAMEGTLEGSLYDFKQDPKGNPNKTLGRLGDKSAIRDKMSEITRSYTRNFDSSKFHRDYYKADMSLYASYFVIPKTKATVVPEAYGVEGVIQPKMIGVSYSGTYKPTDSGRFRLVGRGDDTLVVRVNDKIVLDASRPSADYSSWKQSTSQKQKDIASAEGYFGFQAKDDDYAMRGDWFTLREGVDTDVDVLVVEVPGGNFGAYLLIEKEGVPGLEIFSTRPLSDQDKEFIRGLHPDTAQFLK